MPADNALLDLEGMKDIPLSAPHAVAGLALNFAMKLFDISTVQDGTLYQQYKLEGKNMAPLHIDMIFEAAIKFERFILESPNRLALQVIEMTAEMVSELPDGDAA